MTRRKPIMMEDLLALDVSESRLADMSRSLDKIADNTANYGQKDKELDFYRHWLEENGFTKDGTGAEANEAERRESYESVKETVELLQFAIRNMNDDVLLNGTGGVDTYHWMRENENKLEPNIDEARLKELTQEYERWRERRNLLGAIVGVEDERTNIQSQINRSRKYLDTITTGNYEGLYMAPHRYVQEWKMEEGFEKTMSDLESQLTPTLEKLRDKLQIFISQNAERLRPEDYKSLMASLKTLEEEINERKPFASLKEDTNALVDANKNLRHAQNEYRKAMEEGTEAQQANAKATLEAAEAARRKAQSDLTKSLKSSANKLREWQNIGSNVTDMLVTLNIEPPEWLTGATDGLGTIADGLDSIDLTKPFSIISGSVKAATGIFKTIGSTIGSWLGGNDKEVMETVNRLTESNEYLRESIDSLAERIGQGDNTNAESIDYYNDARKAELEWEENQRNIIKGLASAWTNSGYGFLGLGGKGSFNKHSPGSGWEGWDAFTETLRKNGFNITVDSTGDLWNLTPEQMELLRDSNPKEWQKLFSGDGHKNPKSAVEEYIERAGTLEELTDALNEKLTGYTWDGFLEKYKEMVRSAEDITEELGDFISETVTDALIESFVNEELKDDIKELYEYIADAAADGISEEEKARIEAMNSAIADKAESWREAMTDSGMIDPGSYGTSQSGRAGAYTAMSQEQGTKIEGLWTTSAMHLSSMDEKMQDVSAQMGTAVDSLRRIEENTGNSAKHLGEIKNDIKKIIRDGLKMK